MTTNNEDFNKRLMYDNSKKDLVVALLLWWFLGIFGAHDFYLGDSGRGIAKIVLFITVIGIIAVLIWELIDLFTLSGRVKQYNLNLMVRMGLISPGAVPPAV